MSTSIHDLIERSLPEKVHDCIYDGFNSNPELTSLTIDADGIIVRYTTTSEHIVGRPLVQRRIAHFSSKTLSCSFNMILGEA